MKNPRLFVKQHPVAVFLVLAFFLSWWPSLLYVLHIGNFPPILPLGPLLAALIVLPLAVGGRPFGNSAAASSTGARALGGGLLPSASRSSSVRLLRGPTS